MGLPAYQGRGVDRLPRDEQLALMPTVPRDLQPAILADAFAAALDRLEEEARRISSELADRLSPALDRLRASIGLPSTD